MLEISAASIALGYAFAGLGYLIGLFLLSSPFTSKSMKIKGNEMMEYSIICSFYLALCHYIINLTNLVYNTISSLLGGNLIGGGTLEGVGDYYFQKFLEQLIGFFLALAIPMGAGFIPLVGAAISMVCLVALSPFVLLFGLTISTFFTVAIVFYIFSYLNPILISLGSALIPMPNKMGKKIGGLLIASSITFEVFGPAIPTIADIISKGAFTKSISSIIDRLYSISQDFNIANLFEANLLIQSLLIKGILGFFLNVPYAFAFGTLLGMLFLVVAIEGVSEGIGGAGEKIIEV